MDRIDLHINVPAVEVEKLLPKKGSFSHSGQKSEKSTSIRKRIIQARKIQTRRFSGMDFYTNAKMKNKHIKKFCHLSNTAYSLLKQAVNNYHLSARTYFRLIKVSQTIADLGLEKTISEAHVAEALQYRIRIQKD